MLSAILASLMRDSGTFPDKLAFFYLTSNAWIPGDSVTEMELLWLPIPHLGHRICRGEKSCLIFWLIPCSRASQKNIQSPRPWFVCVGFCSVDFPQFRRYIIRLFLAMIFPRNILNHSETEHEIAFRKSISKIIYHFISLRVLLNVSFWRIWKSLRLALSLLKRIWRPSTGWTRTCAKSSPSTSWRTVKWCCVTAKVATFPSLTKSLWNKCSFQ